MGPFVYVTDLHGSRWRYERAPYQAADRAVIVTVDFKRQEGRP